jgi:hypothetical protein
VFSSGTPGKINGIRKSLLVCDADHKIRFGPRNPSSNPVALVKRLPVADYGPNKAVLARCIREDNWSSSPTRARLACGAVEARVTIVPPLFTFWGADVVWCWKESSDRLRRAFPSNKTLTSYQGPPGRDQNT